MSQTAPTSRFALNADEWERIRQLFLSAFIGSPWLLFIEPARRIVSLEATVAAIVLGVLLGIVAAVGLADVDLRNINDVTASIVTLACILAGTIVVWLIVPHQYIGTVIQFALAFTWTVPVTQLLYYRYRVPESR